MPSKVKPIPDGYHTVTPYLTVKDAEALMSFVQKAFGAQVNDYEIMRNDDGSIRHAEAVIGTSRVMFAQSSAERPAKPTGMFLYVEDVDATYKKALGAGAMAIEDISTQFWGDRSGMVKDSNGNTWMICTHVEDVSPEEIGRRMKAAG
jgi:uncharacterized glyoxalase superfamily protein PhnB